eukprot:scaffold488965_cov15-Prasinocladus_malaysianus.AAC.1
MKESAAKAARLAEAVTSQLEGGVATAEAQFAGEALRAQRYQQALEQCTMAIEITEVGMYKCES